MVRQLLVTKDLMEAQENEILCLNPKHKQRKGRKIAINKS